MGLIIDGNTNVMTINSSIFDGMTGINMLYAKQMAWGSIPDIGDAGDSVTFFFLDSTPSLTNAGAAEMAVLTNLRSLNIPNTGVTLLPSTCPVKPDKLKVTANQLDLCDCSMAWLKVREISGLRLWGSENG